MVVAIAYVHSTVPCTRFENKCVTPRTAGTNGSVYTAVCIMQWWHGRRSYVCGAQHTEQQWTWHECLCRCRQWTHARRMPFDAAKTRQNHQMHANALWANKNKICTTATRTFLAMHTLGRHTVVISIHAIHAIRNQIPHNICHLNEIWNIYTNKIVCASNVARSEGKIRTNENVAVRWCCATLEANTNLRGVREHCEHCCQATRSEPNSQSQPHVRCPSAMYTSQSVDKRTGYTAMRRMGLYWKIYTEILKRYLCQESWFMRLAVWHALTAKRASFYVIAFECNGWILSNQHHV